MTNTLWGRATSSNVQKVLWLATELDIPYNLIEVGGPHGGTKTPEYIAMNPLSRVPVWQEPGLTMFESHAILRYLSQKHGPLMPADPIAAAEADVWLEVAATVFNPAVGGIFWSAFRTPVEQHDPARIKAAVAQMHVASAVIEERLGKTEWLGGAEFSLADIVAGSMMHRYYTMEFDRPDRPNLARWTDLLRTRPGYTQHIETSYESLRGLP